MIHSLKWSDTERKIARSVFDAALQRELAETVLAFKALAADAGTAQQMWEVEEFLGRRRREIDSKYDYRYSQLIVVFAQLLREQRISAEDLRGLSDEKQRHIRSIAAL